MERCVLVIDDNPEMLPRTCKAWAYQGYSQRCTKTVEEALEELQAAHRFNRDIRLIALVGDYLNSRLCPIIKIIREFTGLPILILISEYNANEKMDALALDADSYLPIPQTIDEGIITGLAVIRTYERRTLTEQDNSGVLLAHDFYISREYQVVSVKGRDLRLTKKEFDLLWLLAVNQNRTLTYERIFEQVWHDEYSTDVNQTIWTTVNRLRGKLNAVPGAQTHISNERHTGYRFEN